MTAAFGNPVTLFLSKFGGTNLMKKEVVLRRKFSSLIYGWQEEDVVLVLLLSLCIFKTCSGQKIVENVFRKCILLTLKNKNFNIKSITLMPETCQL